MRILLTTGTLALAASLLSACQSAEDKELEGVALSGGNAIAINSSLQIIDPWPAGVQDTDLVVPADRGETPPAGGTGDGDAGTTALSD